MGSRACQCDQTRRGSWVPHTNTGHDGAHHPIEYLHKKGSRECIKCSFSKKKCMKCFTIKRKQGTYLQLFNYMRASPKCRGLIEVSQGNKMDGKGKQQK